MINMANSKKNTEDILKITFAILMIIIGIIGIIYVYNNKSSETVREIKKEIKKEIIDSLDKREKYSLSKYRDYYSLSNMMKLEIIKDTVSWTPKHNLKLFSFSNKILIKENIVTGYIFVRVSLNKHPFTSWESIYIKMNYKGGHLFRPNSLPVPDSISNYNNQTILLYPLNEIPYLKTIPYSELKTPLIINWFDLFVKDKIITFDTFISSWRKAKIEEISIYYEGMNPTDSCLSIIE